MPLTTLPLIAVALATFVCPAPTHHDGDAVRCRGLAPAIRLYGIDAPEMPGSCRLGRRCAPGDPFASRSHLVELTRGRQVVCYPSGETSYGRIVARCSADGVDLSCAMVRDGYAIRRYRPLSC